MRAVYRPILSAFTYPLAFGSQDKVRGGERGVVVHHEGHLGRRVGILVDADIAVAIDHGD